MEKIWLQHYQERVPYEINPDSYSSLITLFEEICEKYADFPAFSNFSNIITYRELKKLADQFASCLQQLGLQKGDRFAMMLPNILQYPVAMFGALRAGLIIVNINPLFTIDELVSQLKDSGATGIIVLANFAHIVEQALPQTNLKHVIVTEIGDLMSPYKKFFMNFIVKYIKKKVPSWNIPHALTFTDALKIGELISPLPITLHSHDIAFLQYTGGTTGIPKGAMLSHRNLIANLEQASAWIKPVLKPEKEIIITALPLYHIFALTANCLTFFKIGALNILITNPRDIKNLVKEIKKIPFTAFTGVNTLFNALIHYPSFSKVNFQHLKLTLGGGMTVQKAVAKRWEEITNCPLLEAYGLTETSPAVTINPLNLIHYNGSVGLPIPSTEISIRDQNNKELPIGQAGELCVRGPQVMQAYWQNPEETKKVFSKDGWLRTGDIAKIDEKGFVRIVDRIKDVIIVSGFNVYPNQIEDVIAQLEGVLEVGVIGKIQKTTNDEIVTAYIVPKNKSLTKEAVIKHCHQHLTGYKIPKQIYFVRELPKTNIGKISRRELRSQFGKI